MRWLMVLAVLLGLRIGPARAIEVDTFSFYYFTGVCSDCQGNVTATLELKNYTLGHSITYSVGGITDQFVSFTYNGSNLVAPFTIDASNFGSVSGSITGPLPGVQFFVVQDNTRTYFFDSSNSVFPPSVSGDWCVDAPLIAGGSSGVCGADNGLVSTWSDVAPAPEPASLALLAAGFAGLGLARFRRRA